MALSNFMKQDLQKIIINDNGSYWFRRFRDEALSMSPHIRFRRIKYGFYRIYWVSGGGHPAYIGECYKEMPEIGHDVEEKNYQLDSKKYYEEYEDNADLIRKIKNFVEGYWDNLDRIKTKIYMLKNDSEFRKEAQRAYASFVIK